jgi:hypothetical protein
MAPRVFNLAIYRGRGVSFELLEATPSTPGKNFLYPWNRKMAMSQRLSGYRENKRSLCPRREMIYDAFVMQNLA